MVDRLKAGSVIEPLDAATKPEQVFGDAALQGAGTAPDGEALARRTAADHRRPLLLRHHPDILVDAAALQGGPEGIVVFRHPGKPRSDARRVGNGWVRTWKSREWPVYTQKNIHP